MTNFTQKMTLEHEINLELLFELRDLYFELHYSDKLYEGGLYDEQVEISNEIIRQVYLGHYGIEQKDIYVSVSRQFGKSFIVFSTIGFLLIAMPKFINKPLTVGFTVNKKEQVKKNYGELKKILEKAIPIYNITFDENTKESLQLSNGSKIVIFSMEAEHNEGETLDFSLVDEAQELKGEKYDKEIYPMLSKTGGVSCFVGVGGYVKNKYYKGLNDENNKRFIYNSEYLVKVVEKRYRETGDIRHLIYLNFLEKAKNELDEVVFKTQYLLGWETGVGSFLNIELFRSFRKKPEVYKVQTNQFYLGIDWGKMGDRTVATVSCKNRLDGKVVIKDILCIDEIDCPYTTQSERIGNRLIQKGYAGFLKKGYCDSTGVGKATIDIIREKIKGIEFEEVTFSEKTKDIMGRNFINSYERGLLIILDEPNLSKDLDKLEFELENLEKYYTRTGYLKYHHPAKGNIHDDYVDSLFLSILHMVEEVKESGKIKQVR